MHIFMSKNVYENKTHTIHEKHNITNIGGRSIQQSDIRKSSAPNQE